MTITYEELIKTVRLMADTTVSQWLVPLSPVGRFIVASDAQRESVQRRYARWYNARHPHRKVAWRRLSVPQTFDAVERWADNRW